jgi:transcriptional regulator with XRE-family HTH domain
VDTLKEYRRQKGLSQKDLADASGVGQDTISGIESGRHEPRPSTLRKLAEALDVQVADFFREPALPKAKAPRGAGQPEEGAPLRGDIPDSLDVLLGRRGIRTRHLANDNLPDKLGGAPLEDAIRIAEEVYTEAEAINPDLVRLLEGFPHDTAVTRLFTRVKTQLLITRLIVADKRGQTFVPVESEAEPVEQKLLEQELALAG